MISKTEIKPKGNNSKEEVILNNLRKMYEGFEKVNKEESNQDWHNILLGYIDDVVKLIEDGEIGYKRVLDTYKEEVGAEFDRMEFCWFLLNHIR